MKGLGKTAIILAFLFLALVIPASILTAIGGKQAADDYDVQGAISNVIDHIDDYSSINITGNGNGIGNDSGEDVSLSSTYVPTGDIDSIELYNTCFEVSVERGSDEQFLVSYDGFYPDRLIEKYGLTTVSGAQTFDAPCDGCPFVFDEQNGKLRFKLDFLDKIDLKTTKAIKGSTLKVTLPASYKGEFITTDVAGEFTYRNLELANITVTNAAGEFTFVNCSADSLSVTNLTGEVNYDGKVGSFEIANGLGDYELKLTAPLNAASNISSVVGDIEIELPSNAKVNVQKDDVLGEVDIDSAISDANGVVISVTDSLGDFSVKQD